MTLSRLGGDGDLPSVGCWPMGPQGGIGLWNRSYAPTGISFQLSYGSGSTCDFELSALPVTDTAVILLQQHQQQLDGSKYKNYFWLGLVIIKALRKVVDSWSRQGDSAGFESTLSEAV